MKQLAVKSAHRVYGGDWLFGLTVTVLIVVTLFAILFPILVPRDMAFTSLRDSFIAPVWSTGDWSHPLGTDNLGKDILSQLAHGVRSSLLVAVAAAIGAGLIGTIVGLLSGYFGGVVDSAVSYLVSAQLALPLIFLAAAVAMALGPSQAAVIIAISISNWVPFARVVRSEVLVIREADYVALAQISGATNTRVLTRHILPNVQRSIIVLVTQSFGEGILLEASLGYLGMGVQPPNVSLGLMISSAQVYISSDPQLILIPVLVLALIALSANIAGDKINDLLDPLGARR